MKPDFFQRRHRITSQRSGVWDYSFPGYYFITTVLLRRDLNLLSKVISGKIYLKPFGTIVDQHINDIKYWNPRLMVDEYVIMPDHIHLLINVAPFHFQNRFAVNTDLDKEMERSKHFNKLIFQMDCLVKKANASEKDIEKYEMLKNEYRKLRRKMIIPKLVGKLKAQSSKDYNLFKNKRGGKNWVRDYHSSIVTPTSYFRVKTYIKNNPVKYNGEPPNLVKRLRNGDNFRYQNPDFFQKKRIN